MIRRDANSRLGMDFMTLMLLGFVMIVAIIPIGEQKEESEDVALQGNVVVELFWDDNANTDCDIWLEAPEDNIVSFMNQAGRVFNLIRDDLGAGTDASGKNYEMAISRGIPDGWWQVNVHLYALRSSELPFPVRVVVSMKATDASSITQLFAANITFERDKQEKTVVSFLVKDKEVIDKHTRFRPLVSVAQDR